MSRGKGRKQGPVSAGSRLKMPQLDVIRASAGSGKTSELVRNYLVLVFRSMSGAGEGSSYYRHILAVTFTNKATNEMKMRILSGLSEIAAPPPGGSRIAGEISRETKLEESWLREKAGHILSDILHNYHYFAISTIDRFFAGLVRSMSFELAIPSGREIELNRERIISAAILSLFEKFTAGSELSEFAIGLSSLKFERELNSSIEKELRLMAKEILSNRDIAFMEKCAATSAAEFKKAAKSLYAMKSSALSELRQMAADIVRFLAENGIDAGELRKGKSGFFAEVAAFSGNKKEWPDLTGSRREITDGGKMSASAAGKQRAAQIEALSPQLSSMAADFISAADRLRPCHAFCTVMMPAIHSMAMAGAIGREIRDYKTEQDVSELSDFDMLISEIVKSSPVPYIYERTGEKYRHYLVDEFQDTSVIQWTNLVPLLANGLSEGYSSLIVGDEKQAIYRWRGGESGQLTSLGKNEMEADINMAVITRSAVHKSLTENRRSSKTVVGFVNRFFEGLLPGMPERIREAYKGHIQNAGAGKITGSVEIRFREEARDKEFTAACITEAIEMYAGAGYGFGDMAVLCRTSKQCGEVTELLTSCGIDALSSQGMRLDASPEVQFLVNWLKIIYRDGDELALYGIFGYLSAQMDESRRGNIIASWPDREGRPEKLREISNGLNAADLRAQSLTEACISIIAACMAGKQGDPFVAAFIDCLNEFEGRHGKDAASFLAWWSDDEGGPELEMPEVTTAVRVMTIHKAKGLEFSVVIAPFMEGKIEASRKGLWTETRGEEAGVMPFAWLPVSDQLLETRYAALYEEEMEKSLLDELNIMYVAMTRASHHLFIISGKPGGKNRYSRENMLATCFELKGNLAGEETGIFRLGELADRKAGKRDAVAAAGKGRISAEWRSKVRLKYRSEENTVGDKSSASGYGNLVHGIMAGVRDLSDLPQALEREVGAGRLTGDQAGSIQKYMEACIVGSEAEAMFSGFEGSVFMERELIAGDGRLLRPDRMAIGENEIILLDYKTGRPDESHLLQVGDYVSALKELTDKKIRAYLLYIGEAGLRRVA